MGGWFQNLRASADRRKTESERIKSKVEKEDFLISQIDEFREKAKQLQMLLATKETKVQELQDIVEQREGEAVQLQNILDEKHDEADRIVDGVREKIEGMASKVDDKMRELNDKMQELNEKFAERLAENAVNSQEQNEAVKELIKEQNEKLNETVQGLNGQFEQLKNDVCEKVHTEDVKCYRNIQTLFEESDEKMNRMKDELYSISSMKVLVKVVIGVSVINLLGLAGYIIYTLTAV